MNTEVLPPAERRDMVRRLVALCHIVNDLVEIAEARVADGGPVPEALHDHARRIQAVVRDVVVDLVANEHAGHSDAA
ncbi:hypothetical protein ACWCPQ_00420 [Nocardia sp. NPDC001965]